jgi:hypothetical protein
MASMGATFATAPSPLGGKTYAALLALARRTGGPKAPEPMGDSWPQIAEPKELIAAERDPERGTHRGLRPCSHGEPQADSAWNSTAARGSRTVNHPQRTALRGYRSAQLRDPARGVVSLDAR